MARARVNLVELMESLKEVREDGFKDVDIDIFEIDCMSGVDSELNIYATDGIETRVYASIKSIEENLEDEELDSDSGFI